MSRPEFLFEFEPIETEDKTLSSKEQFTKFILCTIFFDFYGGINVEEFEKIKLFATEKANKFCDEIRQLRQKEHPLEFSYPNELETKYTIAVTITD